MPRLPTIKAGALPTTATTTTTVTSAVPSSFSAAIPSQMTNLPTPKTTTTITTTTTTTDALRSRAIPRHVSKSATPKARTTVASASSSAVASAHAIPREVTEPAANKAPTTASAAGIAASVAVPSQMAEIATLIARGTATARAIPPGAKSVPRATIAGGGAGLERGAVDSGDVNGLGLVIVAGGDSELDVIALEESAVTVGSDGGLMDEEILAAVVRLDEPEAFSIVEPLHNARESFFRHGIGSI